jgi:dolichol-phosphate mannosyltransferase
LTTELTIVVPTYNEKENISPLIDGIKKELNGINWEIIFVDDDSPDGTSSLVREISRNDVRIRGIQRIKRRGLSSASIEGMLASSSSYICVMDADRQHDEKLLPEMLKELKQTDVDIVIGSRYTTSGSTGTLSKFRVWISRMATHMGKIILKYPVQDSMSGFFMMRRSFFEKVMHRLSGRGFKILLDILVSSSAEVRFKELPYTMRQRHQGESKLNYMIIWDFFLLIANKLLGRIFPLRFISFLLVGLSGVLVHLSTLWSIHVFWSADFVFGQAIATLVAMTSNFILNNHFTYHDKKLYGRNFYRGLISFYFVCSFGSIFNVIFAGWLFELSFPWWAAGLLGAISGAIWNYAVSAIFTWRD